MLEGYSNPIRFRRFGDPREAKKARTGEGSKQKQAQASTSNQKATKKQPKTKSKSNQHMFYNDEVPAEERGLVRRNARSD